MSRGIGTPGRAWPDRFDHQVESIGAVDLARYPVRDVGRDELGLGEVRTDGEHAGCRGPAS